MIRELLIPISEALFWFTGGEMLINTLWFLAWVPGMAVLLMGIPLYLAVTKQGGKAKSLPALVFIIGFFPSLILIVSPGPIQASLMEECRTVTAEITIEGVTETEQIRQCRYKENFYDTEYGPWKQISNR